MTDTTIVTFACNREEHLRISLESWLHSPFPIIVVDYSSDSPIRIDNDRVRVIRVDNRQNKWNRSHAVNIGVTQVETELALILDADLPIDDFEQLEDIKEKEYMAVCHQLVDDFDLTSTGGSCLIWMSDFNRLNGFAEYCEGWGYEDRDFYGRLYKAGVTRRLFLAPYLLHLDQDRYVNCGVPNKWHSHLINAYRSYAYNKHVDPIVSNYGKPIGGSQPVSYITPEGCLSVYNADGEEIDLMTLLLERYHAFMTSPHRSKYEYECVCDIHLYPKNLMRIINNLRRSGDLFIGVNPCSTESTTKKTGS